MKIQFFLKLFIIAGSFMLSGFHAAHAASSVSTSTNFVISDSVFSGANTTGSFTDSFFRTDTVSLAKFDSNLGTLNSVALEFLGVSQRSNGYAIFRDDDWFSEVGGRIDLRNMRVYANLFGFANYFRSTSNRSRTCSDSGSFSATSCSTVLGSSTSYNSNAGFQTTNASILANLTGLGNILATIFQDGEMYSVETDGDDGYVDARSGSLQSLGTLKLTYNYTAPAPVPVPVPVPAAVWLFSTALLPLSIMRRKKLLCS